MNHSIEVMKVEEGHLRQTLARSLSATNAAQVVDEARFRLSEKKAQVAAMRSLIAVNDAAIFARRGGINPRDVLEKKELLAVELINLERLENVARVFDELFNVEERGAI